MTRSAPDENHLTVHERVKSGTFAAVSSQKKEILRPAKQASLNSLWSRRLEAARPGAVSCEFSGCQIKPRLGGNSD